FLSSRRRHTRLVSDWSSDVCSSDLVSRRTCRARQLRRRHGSLSAASELQCFAAKSTSRSSTLSSSAVAVTNLRVLGRVVLGPVTGPAAGSRRDWNRLLRREGENRT